MFLSPTPSPQSSATARPALTNAIVGTSKVVIKLDIAMSDLAEQFGITYPAATGALSTLGYDTANGKLSAGAQAYTLTFSGKSANIASGETVQLTATLSGNLADTEAAGIKVVVKVNGTPVTFNFKNDGTKVATADYVVTKDLVATDFKVDSVTDIAAPEIISITAVDSGTTAGQFDAGDKISITFSEPVDNTKDFTAGNGTATAFAIDGGTWSNGDRTVTYTINTATPAGSCATEIATLTLAKGDAVSLATGITNGAARVIDVSLKAGEFSATLTVNP